MLLINKTPKVFYMRKKVTNSKDKTSWHSLPYTKELVIEGMSIKTNFYTSPLYTAKEKLQSM